MQEQTDRELVTLARAGNKEAFGELLARYQPMALRIAHGMVRQEEVARELVQEAWLAAYLSLHQLREEDRFKSWLYSIVLNVCRSYVRDQKGTTLSLEALLGGVRWNTVAFSDAFIDPQEMAETHELYQRMLKAVDVLSPKERAVTLLFYCEQLSIREIAALLEISESAVKSRLFQARKRLRISYKDRLVASAESNTPRERYAEKHRRNIMIAMNIEGVRRNFWRSDLYIVSLVDETGQRLLNIAIGQQEAYVIAMALHRLASPRPMTLHFMANAFKALNVVLEEVRIEQLQRSPLPFFYAVAQLRNGETLQELDARPSDALGLAVLLGSPISVSEQVLEDAGITLPEGKTPELHYAEQLLKHIGIALPGGKKLRLGYSKTPARDAVVKEIKATLSGIPQPPGEKEFEQSRKNYLRFVLGDDFDQ